MPIKNAQMKITSGFDLNQNPINNSKEVTIFSTSGLKSLTLRTHTDGALRITDIDNNTVTLLDSTLKVPSSLLSDSSITLSKIGQSGATTAGQIVKWSGTAWVPSSTTISATDDITNATGIVDTIKIMGSVLSEASGVASFYVKELKSELSNSVKVSVVGTDTIRMSQATGEKIDFVVPSGAAVANSVLFAGSSNVMNVTSLSSALATSIVGSAGQVLGWDTLTSRWIPTTLSSSSLLVSGGSAATPSTSFGSIVLGTDLTASVASGVLTLSTNNLALGNGLSVGDHLYKKINIGSGLTGAVAGGVLTLSSTVSGGTSQVNGGGIIGPTTYTVLNLGTNITGTMSGSDVVLRSNLRATNTLATFDEQVAQIEIGSGLTGVISGSSPNKILTISSSGGGGGSSIDISGNATGTATGIDLATPFTGSFGTPGVLTLGLTTNGIALDRINNTTFSSGYDNTQLTYLRRDSGAGGALGWANIYGIYNGTDLIGASGMPAIVAAAIPVGGIVIGHDVSGATPQQVQIGIKLTGGSSSARWLILSNTVAAGTMEGSIDIGSNLFV